MVALLLAREAKGLIIGEAADQNLIDCIRETIQLRPEITNVNHVRTIHTAPRAIFVAVSADFRDDLQMGDAERLIEAIEIDLRAISSAISSVYIRP